MKTLILILAFIPGLALAVPPWNTDVLSWTAPTLCSDGSPVVGNCDITGYKIETASSTTGTWSTLTTTIGSVTTYTAANLAAGSHCYRVSAVAASGTGAASDPVCATATPPVPGKVTVDSVAYEIQKSNDNLKLAAVGTVPLGIACKDQDANGLNVVPRAQVTVSGSSKPSVMVARCQ